MSWRGRSARLEQHCEAFLTKVIVMRQYFCDASLAHCMHRDTIRQAIALVGPCSVKRETRHKCVMALRRHFDVRGAENPLGLGYRPTASFFAVLRKEIQEFHQHIFG